MHRLPIVALASLVMAAPVLAQRFEGIVVVGKNKVAAQQAQVVLLGKRDVFVDSARTDAFGGFVVKATKAGKYTLLVRRKGFLPMTTEPFELPENDVLTDTVFLTGRQAELSFRDAMGESLRRTFGGAAMGALGRMIGPDSMVVLRERNNTLADLIRTGRLLGLSLPYGTSSSCTRFSGESYCAQIWVDELPVNLRPDQISLYDVESVLALRSMELGGAVTETRRFDNSRYGVVMVYTSRYSLR